MKRFISSALAALTLAAIFAAGAGARRASYTINTTAAQERAISFLVRRENARRAALPTPLPPVTNADYVQKVFGDAVNSYVESHKARVDEEIRARVDAMTPAQKASLLQQLGIDPDALQ
jgi:hypothetical protein